MTTKSTIKVLGEKLKGKSFAFTGIFNDKLKEKASFVIEAMGGTVVDEDKVDCSSLDYLVVGILEFYKKTPVLEKTLASIEEKKSTTQVIEELKLGELLAPTQEQIIELFRVADQSEIEFWNQLKVLRAPGGKFLIGQPPLCDLKLQNGRFDSINWMSLPISGCDFSKSDFSKSILAFSKISKTNFSDCKMERASCIQTAFKKVDFTRAYLQKAEFQYCNLRDTIFSGADLSGANFSEADVKGVDFSEAKLNGANFAEAKFDEKTKWPSDFDASAAKWIGSGPNPAKVAAAAKRQAKEIESFDEFMEMLSESVDPEKRKKAIKMLKSDRFKLFAQVNDSSLTGVVKSQTDADLVYSCYLAKDGSFGCCTQNLKICGGLRSSICKHILVLLIGLAKAEELNAATAYAWVNASQNFDKAQLDKDAMSAVFIKYKGAEAGEVDWRPTETIPEDYYAF